ncbi:ABC transporter substrate-binding protein [Corynebacterium mastitidis]
MPAHPPLLSRRSFLGVGALAAAALGGCATADPLRSGGGAGSIVVGSQDYYSNEIIAEVYAQALERGGYRVDRQFRIGQREAYLPEIEAGGIDLFPEYTGPLLQYWRPDTEARRGEDVYRALREAVPEGLRVLDQAAATDQNSYTVTRDFARRWGLRTIGDLATVTEPITLGSNSENYGRPDGPRGLERRYGVSVRFTPIEDGGGPLTVQALESDDIQLAVLYTADPAIGRHHLVPLEDPDGFFLASHVVPLASPAIDAPAAEAINRISAALGPEDLVELNRRSVEEQRPAASIAADWLGQRVTA